MNETTTTTTTTTSSKLFNSISIGLIGAVLMAAGGTLVNQAPKFPTYVNPINKT